MDFSFEIKDDKPAKLHVEGAPGDVAAAVAFLIREVYASMYISDKAAAKAFRTAVTVFMSMPDSPVWAAKPRGEGISMILPRKNGGATHE